MGERYLKAEEAVIRKYYPTAARWKIIGMIPDRTWVEISAKARKMGFIALPQQKVNLYKKGGKYSRVPGALKIIFFSIESIPRPPMQSYLMLFQSELSSLSFLMREGGGYTVQKRQRLDK